MCAGALLPIGEDYHLSFDQYFSCFAYVRVRVKVKFFFFFVIE